MLIQSKRLRDNLSKLISAAFGGINRRVPKREKQILFYTNTGVKDNLKTVLDKVASDPDFSDYRLICSCNNPHGVPNGVKIIGNVAGIFAFLRSKYVFYFNGKLPIKPARGQTVVNLWHGIPLKKIGRMLDPSMDLDFSTHYLAPSLYTGTLMQRAFGCPADSILFCGLPRCDDLFNPLTEEEACRRLGFPQCKHIISWMPTFRNAVVSNVCDSDLKRKSQTGLPLLHNAEDLAQCNQLLQQYNTLLWIKLHPSEIFSPLSQRYSNIFIQSDAEFLAINLPCYRLLGSCLALITDYSSVYFDYLLLDRPIGFAVEDLASYAENRGFTVNDPIEQMPGEILQDKDQLIHFLEQTLQGKSDIYGQKRKTIRQLYCGEEIDRHATETLLRKIHLKGHDTPCDK